MQNRAIVALKGKEYTLDFTFNCFCEWESMSGKSLSTMTNSLMTGLKELRLLVYCCLQRYHGSEIRTVEQAGDLLEGVDINDLFLKITPYVVYALTGRKPEEAESEKKKWGENPELSALGISEERLSN